MGDCEWLPEIRKELQKIAQKGVWWSGHINRERKRQVSYLLEWIEFDAFRHRFSLSIDTIPRGHSGDDKNSITDKRFLQVNIVQNRAKELKFARKRMRTLVWYYSQEKIGPNYFDLSPVVLEIGHGNRLIVRNFQNGAYCSNDLTLDCNNPVPLYEIEEKGLSCLPPSLPPIIKDKKKSKKDKKKLKVLKYKGPTTAQITKVIFIKSEKILDSLSLTENTLGGNNLVPLNEIEQKGLSCLPPSLPPIIKDKKKSKKDKKKLKVLKYQSSTTEQITNVIFIKSKKILDSSSKLQETENIEIQNNKKKRRCYIKKETPKIIREKMRIDAEKRFKMQELKEREICNLPKVLFDDGQGLEVNYITLLEEYCLKRILPLPTYEVEEMEMLFLPSKLFIITCVTLKYHELAYGTDKAIAMQMVACRMFQSVQNRSLDIRLSFSIRAFAECSYKFLNYICVRNYWPLPLYETEDTILADKHKFITKCVILTKRTIGKGESERSSKNFAAYKMLKYLEEHPIEDLLSMIVSYMNESTVDKPNNDLVSTQSDENHVLLDSEALLKTLCWNRRWPLPKYMSTQHILPKEGMQKFASRCELKMHVTYGQGETKSFARQQAANFMLQCLHQDPNQNQNNTFLHIILHCKQIANNETENSENKLNAFKGGCMPIGF